MIDWLFVVLCAVVPAALSFARPRAAVTIFLTVIATWAIGATALFLFDTEDLGALLLFLFILLPLLLVATAMIVGTSLAPRPRLWFDAGFLAMVGWWLGLLVLIFGGPSSTAIPEFWEAARFVAIPAIYAGAGGGFGATNKPIRA
jgi:hypothetical protein